MVWGLDKIIGGSSAPESRGAAPQSPPAPVTSEPQVPVAVVTASISPEPAQPTAPSTRTAISPALLQQPPSADDDWFSSRSRKQFTLFAAGATFVLLSTRIASKSLRKRAVQSMPPFYRPSNSPPSIALNGPLEAVEALSVATINVASVTMMTTGGLLWAFDISSITDLRRKIRGGLGVDGTGRNVEQVEEEFEEWLATVLERKKAKEEGVKTTGMVSQDESVLREWKNERGKVRGVTEV